MNITINKELKIIGADSYLLQLLEDVKLLDQKGIAIAVNNQVITRSNWEQFQLKKNDKITIIKATQGGWLDLRFTIYDLWIIESYEFYQYLVN